MADNKDYISKQEPEGSVNISEDVISAIAVARSVTGRKVKSMSTESRGRLSSKRLIAVPPLMAKHGSAAIAGMQRTTNSACRR